MNKKKTISYLQSPTKICFSYKTKENLSNCMTVCFYFHFSTHLSPVYIYFVVPLNINCRFFVSLQLSTYHLLHSIDALKYFYL